jgi:hypothetical protein
MGEALPDPAGEIFLREIGLALYRTHPGYSCSSLVLLHTRVVTPISHRSWNGPGRGVANTQDA